VAMRLSEQAYIVIQLQQEQHSVCMLLASGEAFCIACGC
jgi:hypothetical protein